MAQEVSKFPNQEETRHETRSPFHHQTTDAVEIAINTFMNKVRKPVEFKKDKWKTSVKEATMAANLSFKHVIGTSFHIFT